MRCDVIARYRAGTATRETEADVLWTPLAGHCGLTRWRGSEDPHSGVDRPEDSRHSRGSGHTHGRVSRPKDDRLQAPDRFMGL